MDIEKLHEVPNKENFFNKTYLPSLNNDSLYNIQANDSKTEPFTLIQIKDKNYSALIDSGSAVTIIKDNVVSQIDDKVKRLFRQKLWM